MVLTKLPEVPVCCHWTSPSSGPPGCHRGRRGRPLEAERGCPQTPLLRPCLAWHFHYELTLPSTPWLLKQMNSLHIDK